MSLAFPPDLPRLHRAAALGQKAKVKKYLKARDDVNARGPGGRTALLWAVHYEHIDCVEILLAAGADPSMSADEEFFPLYIAAQNGGLAMATALLRANANIDAIVDKPRGGTALAVAVSNEDKQMAKLLLDAGCETSKSAAGERHPLGHASRGGHTDVVTMLLDGGADVNWMGSDGCTALTAGAQNGSCDVIRLLLERGANVNQLCPQGRTALHMAAQEGFVEVINLFIAAGAAVDLVDIRGGTPLLIAAFCGRVNCVWALLRAGANVSARNLQGSSPLHAAAGKGCTDLIELLLGAGAQADVNLEDHERRTPLALASAFADAKAVHLIIDAGADINRLDAIGRTALFVAPNVKIVKALLDRGADVRKLINGGLTVLHVAGHKGACAGVICALSKAGVDPTVKDNGGMTAADYARSAGHEDAAKLLDLLAAKHRSLISTWIRNMVLELVP